MWGGMTMYDYKVYFWRTVQKQEVDFVLYGENGFHAIEVKRGSHIHHEDLKSLRLFLQDYPQAKAHIVHLGPEKCSLDNGKILQWPLVEFVRSLREILGPR